MKAPKKLYLRKRCKLPYDVVKNEWFEQPPISMYGNIEYTRTDAFIEKACEWLDNNAIKYWGTEYVDDGKMVEDFKNYMKNESR